MRGRQMDHDKIYGCLKLEYPLFDPSGKYKDIADTGFTIYVFDPDNHYHLCEAAKSYELHPVGESFEPKYEGIWETHPDLVDQLHNNLCEYGSDITYMHVSEVEKLSLKDVVYDKFDCFESAVEYWRGNPPF
jgi:hypothetical protein